MMRNPDGTRSIFDDVDGDPDEQTDPEFLRDLAERIRHIAVWRGVDDYDIDRLEALAKRLDRLEATNA